MGQSVSASPIELKTNLSGKQGTITILGSLGRAFTTPCTEKIEQADGRTFSVLRWAKISPTSMPRGTLLSSIRRPGAPEIPTVGVTLAIPLGARNLRAQIVSTDEQLLQHALLAPAPTHIRDSIGPRVYSASVYSTTGLGRTVSISRTARFRRVRFVTISIPLAQVAGDDVRARTKFSVQVGFDLDAPVAPSTATSLDPAFDAAYRAMVANANDLASFAAPFHSLPTKNTPRTLVNGGTFDTTVSAWIDPSAPYIKLTVTRTGLYRISAQELITRSGNQSVANWQPDAIRLMNHGKEVPIWVDASAGVLTAIEFYGERYPGFPNEYYSWETDSNAYFLTTSNRSQTPPLRYTQGAIVSPGQTLDRGIVTMHHERDLNYYGGDEVSDQSTTLHRYNWIPGERFVWQFMRNNNTSVLDTFVLPSFASDTAGQFADLRVFVRGMSKQLVQQDTHTCRVVVNGTKISDAVFTDFDEDLVQLRVPMGLLHGGSNVVSILFPNNNQDSWYLDYTELSFQSPLAPSSDTAIAKGQWSYICDLTSGDRSVKLSSSNGAPTLFDLDRRIRSTPVSSSGNDYHYNVASLPQLLHVAAATSSTFLSPDRVEDRTGVIASLLDTSSGADYIIITHPSFKHASDALALRRATSDGFRTKVVTTDAIFDAFGFGSNVPEALQRYLQFAYQQYPGVPPSFVTLMGDGTWDPKVSMPTTNHRDFVPTFGVPSSDYYFTAAQGTGFPDSVVSNMVIGRISVETPDEAEAAVRKIVEYETRPPADWNRNMLFVIGGSDPLENSRLFGDAWASIHDPNYAFISAPPMNARTSMIRRTNFSNSLDADHIEEIQSAFQRGIGFMYFFGHGAPFITDIVMPEVGTLRNEGMYPVFLTLSCRTGAFAEPNLISLNESFLRSASSGVIMTFGTTGFGEVDYDFYMSNRIFQLMKEDTIIGRLPRSGAHVINFPTICTISKIIQSVYSANLGLQYGQDNSLFEYTVLGDAALGFSFRPQPEFHIEASDVSLKSSNGTVRSTYSIFDSTVSITATLHNYGYSATTPVIVSITDVVNGNSSTIRDTIGVFDTTVTLTEVLTLDTSSIGLHSLHIYIDSLNQFPETNELDNEAIVSFSVSGGYTQIVFPPEGAKNFCDIRLDSLRVSITVPSPQALTGFDVQADTTVAFTNPRTLFEVTTDSETYYSRMIATADLPNPSSGVIWWRTIAHPKNKPDEPSPASSFSIRLTQERSSLSYTTPDQLARTVVTGLVVDQANGALLLPNNEEVRYDIEARGLQDTNVNLLPSGHVYLNDTTLLYKTRRVADGGFFNGVMLLVLSNDGQSLQSVFEFENAHNDSVGYGQMLADSFSTIIAGLPNATKAIVLTNLQPFIVGFTTNPKVTAALQQLGSAGGMVTLPYFGSYALIGEKGLDSGKAREQIAVAGKDGVHLLDTVRITRKQGRALFPATSAASAYGTLRWSTSNVTPNSAVRLLVLGSRKHTGQVDTVRVLDGLIANSADLSTIDPRTYDQIQIALTIERDSITLSSPAFTSLDLQYDLAPEFFLDPMLLSLTPTSIMEGLSAQIRYSCSNLLCVDGSNIPVVLVRSFGGKNDTLARHNIDHLSGHASTTFVDSITTYGLLGDVVYTAIVNPGMAVNEESDLNNAASATLHVLRDSLKPTIDVLFDDHHINSRDNVASKVRINARLFDANPVRVSDSSAIGMMLIQIDPPATTPWIFKGGKLTEGFSTSFATLPTGGIQATLLTSRDSGLAPGTYDLSAWAIDASGNKTDTVDFEFVVAGKNSLQQVMNYPNPFKDKTWFTYRLTASGTSEVKVVIYTIAGRKIRTLTQGTSNQRVGINAIEWDGRDENGNEVGNGTYLYKLILDGTNEDGTAAHQAVLERTVRSR
ncbi:MAG: T9SS type A sorting domain-containing protein [Bacteroidetes bacterium]|nr:T9SS type A sorting domain-containing protein [Bacteroidota bacterium]